MNRLLHVTLAVLLVLLALAGPVSAAPAARSAADAVVGGSCTEADLITALGSGGTITFACGGLKTIAVSTVKVITKDTTLDGGDLITLSGGLGTRLFSVNPGVTFQLKHIVLDGAASTGSDGGAVANHGRLTLDHATIQHSQTDADHSGGAIFSDGPLTLTDSLLQDNAAGSAGGLFANFSQAIVTISNSTFQRNQADSGVTGFGGAIWVGTQAQVTVNGGAFVRNAAAFGGGIYVTQGATATLVSAGAPVLFSQNSARGAGGGIYNSLASLSLTNVALSRNEAHNADSSVATFGGGIDSFQGTLALTDTTFMSDTAGYGGGLAAVSATVTLANAGFVNNMADHLGGSLFNQGSQVAATGASFSGGTAGGEGGGIKVINGGLSLHGAALDGNTAQSGGGLDIDAGTLQGTDITLSNNSATSGFGGGLRIQNGAVTVSHFTVAGNHASRGGGIDDYGTPMTLDHLTLSGNSAAHGAGLYNLDGLFGATMATVSGNMASNAGGALYMDSGGISLFDATLSGNTALFGAGAFVDGGDLTLASSTLSGNAANKAGGAIEHQGGVVLLEADTLSGNSAFQGGGLDEGSAFVTETITTTDTIIEAGPKGANCFIGVSLGAGRIGSGGYNLSSDATCAPQFNQVGDLNSTDAHLGPLANNGGPTLTHLPGAGSPAIDAIPLGANGCGLNNDQRAAPRPINGRCDMGAVEAGWVHPALWLPLTRR